MLHQPLYQPLHQPPHPRRDPPHHRQSFLLQPWLNPPRYPPPHPLHYLPPHLMHDPPRRLRRPQWTTVRHRKRYRRLCLQRHPTCQQYQQRFAALAVRKVLSR